MEGLAITPQLLAVGGIASLAALAAIGVVAFSNAIRSALCLVLNFFLLAILYFTLNAQFLGIIQIVVYTGAIMVLFLFVIMLLNLGGVNLNARVLRDYRLWVGGALGAVMLGLIGSQVLLPLMNVNTVRAPDDFGKPEYLGVVLFSGYVWPFELASFLLLIGIVGSILLAKRRVTFSAPPAPTNLNELPEHTEQIRSEVAK